MSTEEASCDKTVIIEGMYVVIKIKKILLYVGMKKVLCPKYFAKSTWYLCMSRYDRNRTSEHSKTTGGPNSRYEEME